MLRFIITAMVILFWVLLIKHLSNKRNEANTDTEGKVENLKNRRLLRSGTDKMICGVCGGIGSYMNIDPAMVRLSWVFFSIASMGTGLLIYAAAAILLPLDTEDDESGTGE